MTSCGVLVCVVVLVLVADSLPGIEPTTAAAAAATHNQTVKQSCSHAVH